MVEGGPRLRCSNEECPSHDEPDMNGFSVTLVVDADRVVDDDIATIEPSGFVCVYCHADAELDE